MNIAINAAASRPAESVDIAVPVSTDPRRIAMLEQELAHTRDQWMRAEAEVAHVRTRARRDIDEAARFAIQAFAADVVEVAENLRRGVDSLPARSDREPEIVSR